ncbi:hypothetical protein BD309DRAFT_951011 [Dichomitus squalens]|nr:hypothetical protein BD309DRAFT_951011 [Dichomitus squalens]
MDGREDSCRCWPCASLLSSIQEVVRRNRELCHGNSVRSIRHIEHRCMSSNASASPVARTTFIVPHSASVCWSQDQPARYTFVIYVPSPRT